MKIHFPNSAFLGNIDPFLRSFDDSDKEHLEITFNKKWISVHPIVLSMTAALGLSLKDNTKIDVEQLEAKSKHYLERMGLFQLLNVDTGISVMEHESAGRFIPITVIKNSSELNKFITEMIPLLHTNPEQVEPIKYVVSELVRNVFEHSESKNGAVICAQYYKDSNIVRIGVADCGIGIKKAINISYPDLNDLDAIQHSLMPGVTGTTKKRGGTAVNAGAGLFFIKSIAKINRDFFMIYSGNVMYKLKKTSTKKSIKLNVDPFQDNSSIKNDLPYWQGTIVGIDISLDANQKFDSLLDLIRKTYHTDIKERTKLRFKKAKFI